MKWEEIVTFKNGRKDIGSECNSPTSCRVLLIV